MYAAQGDRPTRLPLGIRSVGCLLSGLGAVPGVCFGLIVLMAFTLPGNLRATPTDWLPLLACAAFAISPLLFGIALLTHRRWGLSGAEGSLFTVAGASFVVAYVSGPIFPGLAALGLMLLLLSLGGAAYLRRPSVRHAYRAVAGPPLLWPAQVVRVATRLQPVLRFVGGFGLLGLAAGATVLASTIQPVDSSSWAEFGAEIGRALVRYLAFFWVVSGLLTLWLRHRAFPAAIGAALTLPLAVGLNLGVALVIPNAPALTSPEVVGLNPGDGPLWPVLLLGSVGLLLVLDIVLLAAATPPDGLAPAGGASATLDR